MPQRRSFVRRRPDGRLDLICRGCGTTPVAVVDGHDDEPAAISAHIRDAHRGYVPAPVLDETGNPVDRK